MDLRQFEKLILQALEHEKGGVEVYETALKCAVNDDLRDEREKYLEETKDHLNWELIGKCAKKLKGESARMVTEACEEIEEQEAEHLYHSQGWCRELWIQSLGMKAVLPPPEERKGVKTAIGASRAQEASERNRS